MRNVTGVTPFMTLYIKAVKGETTLFGDAHILFTTNNLCVARDLRKSSLKVFA